MTKLLTLLLGYTALLLLGGTAAFLLGLRALGDAHVGLALVGLWSIVLLFIASWRDLRPWAARQGVTRAGGFALATAGLTTLLWAVYVAGVTLPIAFLTDITATTAGRRVLGVITFVPAFLAFGVGIWVSWRQLGPRRAGNMQPHIRWK